MYSLCFYTRCKRKSSDDKEITDWRRFIRSHTVVHFLPGLYTSCVLCIQNVHVCTRATESVSAFGEFCLIVLPWMMDAVQSFALTVCLQNVDLNYVLLLMSSQYLFRVCVVVKVVYYYYSNSNYTTLLPYQCRFISFSC